MPDVVEVDPGGEPQHLQRLVEAAGAREQRGVHAGRERAAVRGAGFVEVEVGLERAGRDLVGDQVVEHQHVGLLDDLGGADALVPEQHVGGDRPLRRELGDQQRLEAVKSGELLVDAGRRVVSVDDRVGEFEPAAPLGCSVASRRRRPRRGRGSSGPSRW